MVFAALATSLTVAVLPTRTSDVPQTIMNSDGMGFSAPVLSNPFASDSIKFKGYGSVYDETQWFDGYTQAANEMSFSTAVYDGHGGVWFPPYLASAGGKPVLLRLDTATGEMTNYNSWPSGVTFLTSGNGNFSTCLYNEGYVWLIPNGCNAVIRVDITTGEMTAYKNFPAGFVGGGNALRGAIYDNENIWMVPCNGNMVVKLDTATGIMTGYNGWPTGFSFTSGGSTGKFQGAVKDAHGYMWMMPEGANMFVRINLSTGVMNGYLLSSIPGFIPGTYSFCGGIIDANGYIWPIARGASNLLKINTDPAYAGDIEKIAWSGGYSWVNEAFTGGAFDGRYAWMIPYEADCILRVDTTDGSMKTYNNAMLTSTWLPNYNPGVCSFVGAAFDGKNIWLSPFNADRIVCITQDVEVDVVLSKKLNNTFPDNGSQKLYENTNISVLAKNDQMISGSPAGKIVNMKWFRVPLSDAMNYEALPLFSAAYENASGLDKAGQNAPNPIASSQTFAISADKNAKYWVAVDFETAGGTPYTEVRFITVNNLYTPVDIYVRDWNSYTDSLKKAYTKLTLPGDAPYGIPYDLDGMVIANPILGYDIVTYLRNDSLAVGDWAMTVPGSPFYFVQPNAVSSQIILDQDVHNNDNEDATTNSDAVHKYYTVNYFWAGTDLVKEARISNDNGGTWTEYSKFPESEERKVEIGDLIEYKITAYDPNAGNTSVQAGTPSAFNTFPGTLNAPSVGSANIFTAPAAGYYRLETWGANGGNGANAGGTGGYSYGTVYLTAGQKLYFYIGQRGINRTDAAASYNGGGSGSATGNQGGGATDVRIVDGTWNDAAGLRSRLIVAGGGGGGSSVSGGNGGNGGGSEGSVGGAGGSSGGVYGRQAAYSGTTFGIGGNGGASILNVRQTGGGGGGWYGGGSGSAGFLSGAGGGGGGSGFVYTENTPSGNLPSGWSLNSTHYLSEAVTLRMGDPGFVTNPNPNNNGDGYARIIPIVEALVTVDIADQLPAGLQYTGSSPNASSVIDQTVSWDALTLDINKKATVTVITKVIGNGIFENVATATVTDGIIESNQTYLYGPNTTTLSISNTVTGAYGDRTKSFNFAVSLQDSTGTPLTGTFDYYIGGSVTGTPTGTITLWNGRLSVMLIHGKSIIIDGVPANCKVQITQSIAIGYTVSFVDNAGAPGGNDTALRGMTANRTFAFTNARNAVAETGIDLGGSGVTFIILSLTLLFVLTGTLIIKKTLRKRKVRQWRY